MSAEYPLKSIEITIGRQAVFNLPLPQTSGPAPAEGDLPAPTPLPGREHELADLDIAARSGQRLIGIWGAEGSGKTTLAQALVARLGGEYPDAHCMLVLPGNGKRRSSLSPAAILQRLIWAWQPANSLPDDLVELSARYRADFTGQRALMLLDNAHSAEQVAPLLPLPDACLLIVTAAQPLDLPGVRTLTLGGLPEEAATRLLQAYVPRLSEAEAAEVTAACGHLPLAMRLAIGVLAQNKDVTASDYVERLQTAIQQNAGEENAVIRAALGLSYDLLEGALRRHWQQLAYFPASFDLPAAAALWGLLEGILEQEELDAALRSAAKTLVAMQKHGLIEAAESVRGNNSTRHQLHPLVRAFLLSQEGQASDSRALAQRHAMHYEVVLRAAQELDDRYDTPNWQALALFDREWPHIQLARAWAAENTSVNPLAARLTSAYARSGAELLNLRLPVETRIAWLDAALQASRRVKNKTAQLEHLTNLGHAYRLQGQTQAATDAYRQAIMLARQTKDRPAEVMALSSLGLTCATVGDYARAITFYGPALEIQREMDDQLAEANLLGSLGYAHQALNELDEAIEYYSQALMLFRELNDANSQIQVLGMLADTHQSLGEHKLAVEYCAEQLTLARNLDDLDSQAHALSGLGHAFAALNQPEHAFNNLNRAIVLYQELGDHQNEALVSWQLGLLYAEQEDLGRATAYMQVLVDYLRTTRHPDAEVRAAQLEALRTQMANQPGDEG